MSMSLVVGLLRRLASVRACLDALRREAALVRDREGALAFANRCRTAVLRRGGSSNPLWWFLKPFVPFLSPPAARPGPRVAAMGPRSRAALGVRGRGRTMPDGGPVDLALADTPEFVSVSDVPVVLLSEAPPRLAVPGFDLRTDNPTGWPHKPRGGARALGPRRHLPAGVVVRGGPRRGRSALRRAHHVEDVAAFHGDVFARAGEIVRLAANGIPVHVADGDERLAPLLGEELWRLASLDMKDLDAGARGHLSIRMRRAALRDHSRTARIRQVAETVLPDPPEPPLVSVLLATRRPDFLERAVAAVGRQTYPRVELVLILHGDGFPGTDPLPAGFPHAARTVRVDGALSLGSALNAGVEESSGELLAKMDDDDLYGDEHLWDLVLARGYSGADLVGKGLEFVYLAGSDRTLHCFAGKAETWRSHLAGGATLVSREMLDRAGGWRRLRVGTDTFLIEDVFRAGGSVYRAHGAGFVLVRHGRRHTWEAEDAYFLSHAAEVRRGWAPELAGLDAGTPAPTRAVSR